jgi:26S proteasome regulatory subunit T2
LNYLVP